jgi:hypothetical protein
LFYAGSAKRAHPTTAASAVDALIRYRRLPFRARREEIIGSHISGRFGVMKPSLLFGNRWLGADQRGTRSERAGAIEVVTETCSNLKI